MDLWQKFPQNCLLFVFKKSILLLQVCSWRPVTCSIQSLAIHLISELVFTLDQWWLVWLERRCQGNRMFRRRVERKAGDHHLWSCHIAHRKSLHLNGLFDVQYDNFIYIYFWSIIPLIVSVAFRVGDASPFEKGDILLHSLKKKIARPESALFNTTEMFILWWRRLRRSFKIRTTRTG